MSQILMRKENIGIPNVYFNI